MRVAFAWSQSALTHRRSIGGSGRNWDIRLPFLSDSKAEVIRRYDLLHAGAVPKGADIARPAEFLMDSTGTIRWVNLTKNIAVQARPEQVLKAFDETDGRTAH